LYTLMEGFLIEQVPEDQLELIYVSD
jgi:hypothetical protein